MEKRHFLIVVLFFLSQGIFSQETDDFQFFELGAGMGYTKSVRGAFNAGFATSMNNYLAWFIEYNLFYGKTGVLFHEVSMKFGPCYRFKGNTYLALSSGISYIFNFSKSQITKKYVDGYPLAANTWDEDNNLINIPIQLKINIGVSNKIGIGLKGTYNKVIMNSIDDKGTALLYFAIGF